MTKQLYLIQVFKNGKLSKQFVSRTPEQWVARYELDGTYAISTTPILELNLM